MSIRDGMLAWYMVSLSILRQVGECGLLFILLNNIKDTLCGHVRTFFTLSIVFKTLYVSDLVQNCVDTL